MVNLTGREKSTNVEDRRGRPFVASSPFDVIGGALNAFRYNLTPYQRLNLTGGPGPMTRNINPLATAIRPAFSGAGKGSNPNPNSWMVQVGDRVKTMNRGHDRVDIDFVLDDRGNAHMRKSPVQGEKTPAQFYGLAGSGASGKLTDDEIAVLTYTLLGEAGGEGAEGMLVVANVIANRAASGLYSSNPAKVATQGSKSGYHQFSTWNSPDKGGNQPDLMYSPGTRVYDLAEAIVRGVFVDGTLPDVTGKALYYHTPSVSPYWSASVKKEKLGTITVGGHVVYPNEPIKPVDISTMAKTLGLKESDFRQIASIAGIADPPPRRSLRPSINEAYAETRLQVLANRAMNSIQVDGSPRVERYLASTLSPRLGGDGRVGLPNTIPEGRVGFDVDASEVFYTPANRMGIGGLGALLGRGPAPWEPNPSPQAWTRLSAPGEGLTALQRAAMTSVALPVSAVRTPPWLDQPVGSLPATNVSRETSAPGAGLTPDQLAAIRAVPPSGVRVTAEGLRVFVRPVVAVDSLGNPIIAPTALPSGGRGSAAYDVAIDSLREQLLRMNPPRLSAPGVGLAPEEIRAIREVAVKSSPITIREPMRADTPIEREAALLATPSGPARGRGALGNAMRNVSNARLSPGDAFFIDPNAPLDPVVAGQVNNASRRVNGIAPVPAPISQRPVIPVTPSPSIVTARTVSPIGKAPKITDLYTFRTSTYGTRTAQEMLAGSEYERLGAALDQLKPSPLKPSPTPAPASARPVNAAPVGPSRPRGAVGSVMRPVTKTIMVPNPAYKSPSNKTSAPGAGLTPEQMQAIRDPNYKPPPKIAPAPDVPAMIPKKVTVYERVAAPAPQRQVAAPIPAIKSPAIIEVTSARTVRRYDPDTNTWHDVVIRGGPVVDDRRVSTTGISGAQERAAAAARAYVNGTTSTHPAVQGVHAGYGGEMPYMDQYGNPSSSGDGSREPARSLTQ